MQSVSTNSSAEGVLMPKRVATGIARGAGIRLDCGFSYRVILLLLQCVSPVAGNLSQRYNPCGTRENGRGLARGL